MGVVLFLACFGSKVIGIECCTWIMCLGRVCANLFSCVSEVFQRVCSFLISFTTSVRRVKDKIVINYIFYKHCCIVT